MLKLLLVEDNPKLQPALKAGLESSADIIVIAATDSGENALELALANKPDVILMDVQLAGKMNGIEATVAIRREYPRMPVVFYSIQDDDDYYRDFRRSGILSHYAYVRKSNFLLPAMIVPLLRDAISGRSYIDPDIESRVHEVRQKDANDPIALLEPNEAQVALMLADGMSNQHIAKRLGFRDKRTISRVNGQIYTAWGLKETATDEKVARTRAAIILRVGQLLHWDDDGNLHVLDELGKWSPYEG